MSESVIAAHPDHDLEARRAAAWARHHAQVARIAAAACASAAAEIADGPAMWERPHSDLMQERRDSHAFEAAMRVALEECPHDLIDRAAVAWRRAKAGDAAAAADVLERALDETFPAWRLVCPW